MSITTRSMRNNSVPTPSGEEKDAEEEVEVPLEDEDCQETVIYTLTPALVTNEPIDYSTVAGAKIYKQATEKLKTE